MPDPQFFDLHDGTGVWQYYDPQPGFHQIDQFYNLSTGVNFADLWDLSSGDSYFGYFNTSAGVDQITYHYSGWEGSGTLLDTDVNYTNNGSTITTYDSAHNVQSWSTHYTGANEAGVATNSLVDFVSGGSANIIYAVNGQLPSNIQQLTNFYNYADAAGPVTFAQTNYTNGTSQQVQYNPQDALLNTKSLFTGLNETGTMYSSILNFSQQGSSTLFAPQGERPVSEVTTYNLGTSTHAFGNANIASETVAYTGFDGTGGVAFIAANFATPDSHGAMSAISYNQDVRPGFFDNSPGGSRSVIDYHAGLDVGGSLVYKDVGSVGGSRPYSGVTINDTSGSWYTGTFYF